MHKNNCFASDNCSGVHPRIMDALMRANEGYALSYGADPYTQQALQAFSDLFGDVTVYFVYNGTGANTLALGAVLKSYQAVITCDTGHINCDETGAPEKFTGCKIIDIPSADGKLRISDLEPHMHTLGVMHHSQPRVVSITNPTEVGTLYTVDEISKLSDYAHAHHMLLHMDGARIANAAVALHAPVMDITGGAGVDLLSFGGTKNGMMFGEAVVFFDKALGADFMYVRKNGTQLHSKMRYISAQFEEYFKDGLWLRNARHANQMAQMLAAGMKDIRGIELAQPVQANAVFAVLPEDMRERLLQSYFVYDMDVGGGRTADRFMCSYSCTEQDVDGLLEVLRG